MSKQLLIETYYFTPLKKQQIFESKKSERGNLIVQGVLATVEQKNGNGRYYSRELWERELEEYQKNIDIKSALGELDHPDSEIIELKNVSHNILKIWWGGDNILGEIEILPTPSGQILKTLLENKITVGISSRGMGSLVENGGIMEVQDDFSLTCWDFVSNPSNQNSWFKIGSNSQLNESKQTYKNNKHQDKVHQLIRELLCLKGKGYCPLD